MCGAVECLPKFILGYTGKTSGYVYLCHVGGGIQFGLGFHLLFDAFFDVVFVKSGEYFVNCAFHDAVQLVER